MVDTPDLRTVGQQSYDATRTEMTKRQRITESAASPAGKTLAKHLPSGLIRCAECGSKYTISGKDQYRCAGQKQRGTCTNRLSVRNQPVETATLAVLQSQLLTEEHARISVEEFRREAEGLAKQTVNCENDASERSRQLEVELGNLTQNLLTGLASPTVLSMIAEREHEKAKLQSSCPISPSRTATEMLSHPILLQRFNKKIAANRETLDNDTIRSEADLVLAMLIESVTIYPDAPNGPEAEVVAKTQDLIAFATNDDAAPEGGDGRWM